jgi:hypothetical protein
VVYRYAVQFPMVSTASVVRVQRKIPLAIAVDQLPVVGTYVETAPFLYRFTVSMVAVTDPFTVKPSVE